jgi:hypothetical protein
MKRRKRPFWLLIISFLSLGALGYWIWNFSPDYQITISHTLFPILPVFLFLLFLFIFSLFTFLLNNSRRGFLLGLLAISYLLLRLNGLTSPFFAILLLILFAGVELFFIKRR